MHKIHRSLFPTDTHIDSFQRLANKQIEEMRIHDAHMKMVAKDPNYHPYPAPLAHPDIMNVIVKDGDDYNIEFELIDDPEPTLEEKKEKLVTSLSMAILEKQQSLLPPPLKQKLFLLEINAITKLTARTPEQQKKLDDHKAVQGQLQELHLIVAKAESEIHDLTDETIDKWKLPVELEIKK